MAYRIDPGGRRRSMGTGQGYELEESDNRSKGETRVKFKDKRVDWWARVETTLSLLDALRTRGRKLKQQAELARVGRTLARTMLPLQGSPSDTALLHYQIWRDRLHRLEEIADDVISGMATQAEAERQAAVRELLPVACGQGSKARSPAPHHQAALP
eukprot:1214935-Pyramimonas_sp.AAC.1